MATAGSLSARGSRVLAQPRHRFTAVYYDSQDKLFDAVSRPSGIVNLAVAENKLAAPLVLERLRRATRGLSLDTLAYNPYPGCDRFRAAIARVASRKIAKCKVDPAQVVLTSGAGSALWTLSALLADAGRGVLVPAPYYYAYNRDLGALTDCQVVPFHCDSTEQNPLDPAVLTRAFDEAANAGVSCRLLMITNPCNPTGAVTAPDDVRGAVAWAANHGVDVVVNELYACSATPDSGFRSVLELFQDGGGASKLPGHVHFVWGMSKDFAVNGLRVGCLLSGSPEVTEAAKKMAYFFQVAAPVQVQLAECLEDDDWVDEFLEESKRRIDRARGMAEATLRSAGARFDVPGGGLFLWVDLGAWVKAAGGEAALFERLVGGPDGDGAGVLLCPGSTFAAPQPGLFRICVSAAPEEHLAVGLERLSRTLSAIGGS